MHKVIIKKIFFLGMIHRRKTEMFSNYIRNNFWWDLVVVIPFILSSFSIPFTEYTLLIRVTRVRSMMESLEDVINLKEEI